MPLNLHTRHNFETIENSTSDAPVIALAGNPNVGKSTLFNRLTGMHQHTGNWTGKTVEVALGQVQYASYHMLLVDLPGTYSLHPASGEECVARDFLLSGKADAVIAVCDSTRAARTLALGLQIADLGIPVLICLNLCDSAAARGIQIDADALSREISLPVVLTSGKGNQGLDTLLQQALALATQTDHNQAKHSFACQGCDRPGDCDRGLCGNTDSALVRAQRACAKCITNSHAAYGKRDRFWDHLFLGKLTAFPILLCFTLLLLWLSAWGAGYPSFLLEQLFALLCQSLRSVLLLTPFPLWLQSLLIEGVLETVCRVVAVMLPPMAIFFPLFALLEDLGYLPRAAVCFDRALACCGSGGKQALTMCMGLGCNAVGVCGCRIIESPRQRTVALLTCSFMPCNGKYAAILSISALFFGAQGGMGVLALLLLTGVCVGMTLLCTRLLTLGTKKQPDPPFALELPALRAPHIGQILSRSFLDRTLPMLGRAVAVAAPAGALIWIAGHIQWEGQTILQLLQTLLQPIGLCLGLDGAILLAFLLSFPANELLIPSLLAIYGGSAPLAQTLADHGWTLQTAICMLILLLFHLPCATTLWTVWRETHSYRQTLLASLLPLTIGIAGCLIAHALFSLAA